jgi:hypothetical protein
MLKNIASPKNKCYLNSTTSMTKIHNATLAGLAATMLGLLAWTTPACGQTYTPTNWVNDPFSSNPNYELESANTTSPSFRNNGADRGTLSGNSPIGAMLRLVNPGDTLACTGQVTISGDVNADGDMQFRVGLYYQGTNNADTNWLGYMFGNATGAYAGTTDGLYVRNNPNQGIYSSGSPGNAMRPPCGSKSYIPGWEAATYDFSLSVTLLPANAHAVSWKLAGVAPNAYLYAGAYTNNFVLTVLPAFDQVGVMGGAALFSSASTSDGISFKDVKVTLSKHHDGP